jgi:hypothetical protein
VATTLQQLLDALTDRATAPAASAAIEDVTGALAHLGRALTGLTDDGLTPTDSSRQRTATELGAACATAGGLWPRTGGPLTDLAGAAADLVGRDRPVLGRAHRWAVTVELAEVADHSAGLASRLLPQAAVAEMAAVRRLAAAVERDALADPPTAVGVVVLDRLVPPPDPPHRDALPTAIEASAALVAALNRTQRVGDLTLRDFRAAVAAAEITSRCAATVTAAATGDDVGPLLVTGLAWQLAGRTSMAFHDGHRAGTADPRGVVAWAQALAGALRAEVAPRTDIAALRDRSDLPSMAHRVRQITAQLPALGHQLAAAVQGWSRTGRLVVSARDLPPVEDMPADRIDAVITGRHVMARGADLDQLRRVVNRAADLSTGLAGALHRASTDPKEQRHQVDRHARGVQTRDMAERLLDRSQATEHAITAIRSPRHVAREAPPSR